LPVVKLNRPRPDVVEDCVAEDVVEGLLAGKILGPPAEHDSELHLVVDCEAYSLNWIEEPGWRRITSSAGGIAIASPGPMIAVETLMKSHTTSSGKTKPGSSSPWFR
jgi:hypothetical protein